MLLKVRMKISFSAFAKDMTINELFLKAIEDAYYQRKKNGLLRNPWPKADLKMIKLILGGQTVEEAIVQDFENDELDKCCVGGGKFKFNNSNMPANYEQSDLIKNEKFKANTDLVFDREEKEYQQFRNIVYIKKSLDRNKTEDIFKEILQKTDNEMPPDEIAGDWVKYKFKKNVLT
jgi:hypothetical protein